MATGGTPITEEETNFIRGVYLCYVIAPEAVRSFVTSSKKSVKPGQPTPKSTDFDILMIFPLRNKNLKIEPPPKGFYQLPDSHDNTTEANIARINFYRNKLAHSNNGVIQATEFKKMWFDLENAISGLTNISYGTKISKARTISLDGDLKDILNICCHLKELKSHELEDMKEKLKIIMHDTSQKPKEDKYGIRKLDEKGIEQDLKLQEPHQEKSDKTQQKWPDEKRDFVEKDKTLKKVLTCVRENQSVTVTGSSGTGKTTVMKVVACMMKDDGYVIIPTKQPDDIKKYSQKGTKMLFVFDNVCGIDNLNVSIFQRWNHKQQEIKSVLNQGDSKLISTCRPQIVNAVIFKELQVLNQCICDLSSDSLKLCDDEKFDIANREIELALFGKQCLFDNPILSLYSKRWKGSLLEIVKDVVWLKREAFPELSDRYQDILNRTPNLQSIGEGFCPYVMMLYNLHNEEVVARLKDILGIEKTETALGDDFQAIICILGDGKNELPDEKDKDLLLHLKTFYYDKMDNVLFILNMRPTFPEREVFDELKKWSNDIISTTGIEKTYNDVFHRLFTYEELTEALIRLSLLLEQQMIDHFKNHLSENTEQTIESFGEVDFRYHQLRMISRRCGHIREFGFDLRLKSFYVTVTELFNLNLSEFLEFSENIYIRLYKQKKPIDYTYVKSGDKIRWKKDSMPTTCGTAGFFLKEGERQFVATCQHVVYKGNPESEKVYLVAREAGERPFLCLQIHPASGLDFAVCQIDNTLRFTDGIRDEVGGHIRGTIMTERMLVRDFNSIQTVYKWGVATEFTSGVVKTISEDATDIHNHYIKIEKQDVKFSRQGDSGALVFYRKNDFAIAAFTLKGGYETDSDSDDDDEEYTVLMTEKGIEAIKASLDGITPCF